MKAQVEEIKAIGDTITDKNQYILKYHQHHIYLVLGNLLLNEMIEIIGAKIYLKMKKDGYLQQLKL